jgi:hypothetical protein
MRMHVWLLLACSLVLGSCGGGAEGAATCSTCSAVVPDGAIPGGGGITGAGDGSAGTGGTGSSGGDATGGVGSGVGDGTGVAGGVGSGGTGVSGDGGVGSGGTGVSASAAVGIGSVDGFGSVIVNGIRHEIGGATLEISDASELKLGMTVRVAGTVSATQTAGTATSLTSAADLRGTVSLLNSASASFAVQGALVTTDNATIFDGVPNLSSMADGDTVQIYGLPGRAGELRATRVEKIAANAAPVVSGAVSGLDSAAKSFRLGSLTVSYANASFTAALPESGLANGLIVRVRATSAPDAGVLAATTVQPWHTLPAATGTPVNLSGIVTEYAGPASFKLQGIPINASTAAVTGGLAASIGNGVKVEVAGIMDNGVLVAARLKIRHVPGTGGPVAFSVSGAVSQFVSASSFRVQGQPVDAGGPNVVFSNGSAAQLANGRRVSVSGSQVVQGVLVAEQVAFD